MSQAPVEYETADALVEGLVHGNRPVVFLVGAPLTMPTGGAPGVPGVSAMVTLIGDHLEATARDEAEGRRRRRRFAREVEKADGSQRYQRAFDHLAKRGGGLDAANAVVRAAVLRARTDGATTHDTVTDLAALAALEAQPDGWHLGPAVKALGLIAAGPDRRFGGLVLTTNFDPLIEVAVRAGGGAPHTVTHLGDGVIGAGHATGTRVVHLHGFWRDDTQHTGRQLTVDRPALRRSLARLLDTHTLVVMAYGGWRDAVAETLVELAADPTARPDIRWCFYQDDPISIERAHSDLLAVQGRLRGRMSCYRGVDCNVTLPRLRAELDREGELIGRRQLCDAIEEAMEDSHAVQILGEPYMKRSRVLKWAARTAETYLGLTPVRINAGALARPEPEALLRAIADGLGKYHEVDAALQRDRALPNVDDAIRCLPMVAGACVLIDDADALFEAGHGFEVRFFDVLRSMVQAGELRWVSVSRQNINELFKQSRNGQSSDFLNDAQTFHAGGLDSAEIRRALTARLGKHADAAFEAAGTLPKLVYRLFGAEWGDVEGAITTLGAWSEGLCAVWWGRSNEEQRVLKQAVDGIAVDALSAHERQIAQRLVDRGLMIERDGAFALNGSVWSDFVRAVD